MTAPSMSRRSLLDDRRGFMPFNKTGFVALLFLYFITWMFVVKMVFNPIAIDMAQQGVEYNTQFDFDATVQNFTDQTLQRERGFFSSVSFALDSVWDGVISFMQFFAGGQLVVQQAPTWFTYMLGLWNGALAAFGIYLLIEVIRGV